MTYNQLSKEQINERLKDKKIYISGDYVNSKEKTNFTCLVCNETFISSYDLVRSWKGIGCTKCKNSTSLYKHKDQRISHRLENIYKYKSDCVEIIKIDEEVNEITCRCLICNEIYITSYASVKKGSKHRKCAMVEVAQNNLMTKDDVINKIRLFQNDITVDFSNYYSTNHLLSCHCNVCGNDWKAKQRNLIRGRGCPECAIK